MSTPRGSREFRGSARGRGQAYPSSRGKPTLLQRGQSSGNSGAGGNLLMNDGSSGGRIITDGIEHIPPQYGAPPKSAFGIPAYGAQQSFAHLAYESAPSVQGPSSAFAPEIQKPTQQMLSGEESKQALPAEAPFLYLRQEQKLLYHPFQSSPYAVLHAPPLSTTAGSDFISMQQQHAFPQFVSATVNQQAMPSALAMQYARGLSSGIPSSFSPLQHRAQQQYYQMMGQQVRNEPKWCVEPLSKISPTLKKIVCFTPNKKLAALVETNDEEEIIIARSDLLEDFMKYDGRSNVPISRCSMPYLKKRQIEYLVVPHSQFPWAPYYCVLCDHHISDLFAAEAHLPTHIKEEKRLDERRTLHDRLPPIKSAQLSAIEKVLVEAAVSECRPHRETILRETAVAAMDSVKKLCKNSQFNEGEIHLSLHGSLISGILTNNSDINISLRVGGENTKFFVDGLFTAMEKASDWSDVKLNESPTGQARLEGVFNEERITIDWQNDEGVKISQLLSLYNSLHEDVLPLRQIVRKWAEKCDLTTAEKLSSQHAVPPVLLDVMIIHALQQSNRLPCIHEIRKRSGKDIYDTDLKDLTTMMPNHCIRWNLAELFLEFLLYFSKGDIKHFLIQITSTARILKTDTKFNKKHLNVIDPIRDRPIASLHKAFQCYFINCFLTSYVHFRIPRIKDVNGILSKALVNIDVYQTASQSPLKKKSSKGGKREDNKEEGEQAESPASSSQQPVEIPKTEMDMIDSPIGSPAHFTNKESIATLGTALLDASKITNAERLDCPPPFLASLLDSTLDNPTADSGLSQSPITIVLASNCSIDEDDSMIDARMAKTDAHFLIGLQVGESVSPVTRTSRSTVAHTIRVGIPSAHLSSVIAMREATIVPPFAWKIVVADDAAVVVVDMSLRNGVLPAGMRLLIGVDNLSENLERVSKMMNESEHAIAIGMWKGSGLNSNMDKWTINEEIAAIGRGVKMEKISLTDDGMAISISIGKPIFIHGKPLEDMLPGDFEINGDQIYSRQEIMRMKECSDFRMNKEMWEKVYKEGLNTLYPPPDSDDETSVGTPRNTPSSSKNKRKSKRKKETQLKVNEERGKVSPREEDGTERLEADSLPMSPKMLSIGQCATAAINVVAGYDQASTSSARFPTISSNTLPKVARRVLKLIKLDSAESSEISCEPSPTEESHCLDEIGDLTLKTPALTTLSAKYSNRTYQESSANNADIKMERNEVKDDIRKDADGNEEIVLPESFSSGLQPTFEELHVDLKEYDLNEVSLCLERLSEYDYDYSFDNVQLTAGFKCDQHCSACDSPKHLVTECPQLKVPPIREISRSHWKPHFSHELDRIICMIFDNEKISTVRRKELKEVKNRLKEAIKKKLKKDFRLDAFGSSENGFGSNRSDFDVCFRYSEDSHERSSEMQIHTIINIENALRYARFNRVMSITTAKVPIVKFATRVESGEIEGDISYYNELALHNTQLLKRYCSWTKDEVLSKLGMFIKKWAKNCDIGDASKGSLSSYAYIILVIHFLQRLQPHPLLPVLQEMGEKLRIQVDGWDVYFCDDAPKPSWSQCTLSVGELFLQFLEHFAKFDWHNQVVQIRQTNKLTKIERGWRKLMCIEDPFDLDHNLGSGISPRMFAFIMKSFVTSREVFFSLKERESFVRKLGAASEDASDIVIADNNISRYGEILFAKCRASIGGAPRDRQCFKCGRIGHFSDACPAVNSGFARRGGGRGGGPIGREGIKKEDNKFRDARKERLMAQRESYRTANEK